MGGLGGSVLDLLALLHILVYAAMFACAEPSKGLEQGNWQMANWDVGRWAAPTAKAHGLPSSRQSSLALPHDLPASGHAAKKQSSDHLPGNPSESGG